MYTMKATIFEDFRLIMTLPPPRFNVLWIFVNNCHETTSENKLIALKTVESNIKHLEESLFIRKPWKS